MKSFKISTLTEQFPNQLAQGKGGKEDVTGEGGARSNQNVTNTYGHVILAKDGDPFFLEKLITTEGGDNRAIIAPRLGMLQVLASLAPVFKPGCNELSGEVRLSLEDSNDRFPWRFETDNDSAYTITVREQSIPDRVVFPAGGKVFLVWEGTEVKWMWSGGVVPAVPSKALWVLEEIDQVDETLEQVKITLFSRTKIALMSIARDDTDGTIILTEEGDTWFLRSSSTNEKSDDPVKSKTSVILSPSLGALQVLAQLAPIFPTTKTSTTTCHGGDEPSDNTVEQKGELGLSVAVSGKEFPWVFDERTEGGITISAPAPPELAFPAGGRVYLVWNLPNAVRWEFSGGIVEDIPRNAMWTVARVGRGGKAGGGTEHTRAASAAPAT